MSEPWRAALRTFDADLQRRGSADRTRRAYGTDAAELAASLDGIGKLTALLSPVVAGVDPALDARIAADLQRARDDVAALQARPWSEVTDDQRQALVQDFTRLADTLDRLAIVIGMN